MSTNIFHPGERFAGHVIERRLASGDGAAVYRAVNAEGKPRALKVLQVPRGGLGNAAARFSQEGVLLTLIAHDNVVRCYDAGAIDDLCWLSLELVPGVTLAERLSAGEVPLDDLLRWVAQACDGVAEAHRVGVVHRNLSPENLLVTEAGSVKVIDLGVAKLRGWGVMSALNEQLGTAMHMAPEQLFGAPADPRMDIHAVAVILYQAITGRSPMGDVRTMDEITDWHRSGARPRPLREVVSGLPTDLGALVDQGLAKNPADRPASMVAVARRLRAIISWLQASPRRAARNMLPDADPRLGATAPMPIVEPPPPNVPVPAAPSARATARGGTIIMAVPSTPAPSAAAPAPPPAPSAAAPAARRAPSAAAPAPPPAPSAPAPVPAPSDDRPAMAPPVGRTLASAVYPPAAPAPPRGPVASPPDPAGPRRSSADPVELAARVSRTATRRTWTAALVGSAVTLAAAAAGWALHGHMAGPAPSAASGPGAAPTAPPCAPAPTPAPPPTAAPTASASASATASATPSARPGLRPEKAPRSAPAARTPGKN
jgi:serine/threonine-protein kinase